MDFLPDLYKDKGKALLNQGTGLPSSGIAGVGHRGHLTSGGLSHGNHGGPAYLIWSFDCLSLFIQCVSSIGIQCIGIQCVLVLGPIPIDAESTQCFCKLKGQVCSPQDYRENELHRASCSPAPLEEHAALLSGETVHCLDLRRRWRTHHISKVLPSPRPLWPAGPGLGPLRFFPWSRTGSPRRRRRNTPGWAPSSASSGSSGSH